MLSGGANRWTNWVKEFASKNNLSYGCALSTPECKEEYRAKYGNRKKLSQKKEKEMMGMEDKNVAVKKGRKKRIVLDDETAQEIERERMGAEEATGVANKRARHKEKVVELKSKLNKNLALKGIVEKGKQLQERNEMGAEDINRAVKKIKVKKPKQPIQLIIEEDEEVVAPKKRGRPRKYATAEEARQMKIQKTIEASKRRQAKKREEKAVAKANKKKPALIIEDDSDEETGKGFNPLPDFKQQVLSAEGGMINPLSDPAFAKEYARMKQEEKSEVGGHWTSHLKPHLEKELSNYQNIIHHLGQHLHEKGAKDPKDITGFHHFSREADRVKNLLARI